MKLVTQQEIARVLDFRTLIPALRQGFIDYSRGLAHSAPITNIDFAASHGEMHIKPGYLDSTPDACVKVVTCFYDNPRQGLPTRDGCIVFAHLRKPTTCLRVKLLQLLFAERRIRNFAGERMLERPLARLFES